MKLFQTFISSNINEDTDINIKIVIEMKLRSTGNWMSNDTTSTSFSRARDNGEKIVDGMCHLSMAGSRGEYKNWAF